MQMKGDTVTPALLWDIIKLKIRWYNEGEKNTKYFLNLEKRHCKEGTISQLKQNANNFVTSDQEILAECH